MTGRHCQKWRHKRQLAADVHVDVDADADVDVGVFTHIFNRTTKLRSMQPFVNCLSNVENTNTLTVFSRRIK